MLTVERENKILELVEKKSFVTVTELSEMLGVSEVTIRKMLNNMDSKGYLRRTHGGAVSMSMVVREYEEREKEKQNIKLKRAIAKVAYEKIEDSDTIFIDAGSTTLELARLIKRGNKRNIVIVTNALNIAYELVDCSDIELIMVGGCVRHKIMSCVGGFAEDTIKNMCFDKSFMGANSFDVNIGVTTPNLYEAGVKKAMIEHSNQCYLICDSSKYGKHSMVKVGSLDKYNTVITDNNLSEDKSKMIIELGVNLIKAKC